MLKIAVPNKGALSEAASGMLREAGYAQRTESKQLTKIDPDNEVEFFYLRPRDIALYVGEGTLDAGITGRDLLLDSRATANEALQLGFGRSKFRYAARPGTASSIADLAGKRIATSYEGVVKRHLDQEGITASVVRLDGAVETSIQLGVADVIADVVETGSTLRNAGLEVFGEVILESEAVMITRADAEPTALETFTRRLQGVLVARSYVMMDYDIEAAKVEQATALTPGIEGPTISPLRREGWVAVRSMVKRAGAQRTMDELYALGARAILTTDIHAARL
ncbi:ATP phosphoribosyltransferase [Nocardioides sp. LML1-1-1.1]|uniref:ATP phosphoribosyltransferase n=1 Tax=Nocardioides sp. LML1-1-1.1 TaxID=3135248 RepID=UPI00341FCBEC